MYRQISTSNNYALMGGAKNRASVPCKSRSSKIFYKVV